MRRRHLVLGALSSVVSAATSSCSEEKPEKKHASDDKAEEGAGPALFSSSRAQGSSSSSSSARPSASTKEPDRPLAVGLVLPVSGDFAEYGNAMRLGFMLERTQFVLEDAKATATPVLDATQKLVDGGASVVVVDPFGTDSLPAARYAQDNKVPILFINETSPAVLAVGDHVFFTCTADDRLGAAAVTIVKRRKRTRVAIAWQDAAASRAAADGFRARLKADGLDAPVLDARVDDTVASIATYMDEAAKKKADAIFAALDSSVLATMGTEAKRKGIDSEAFLGVDTMATDKLAEKLPGAWFLSHYHASVSTSVGKAFIDKFEKKYRVKPNVFAALAYDAALIIDSAISRASAKTSAGIRDALASTSALSLTTGPMSYDPGRSPLRSLVIGRFAGSDIALEDVFAPTP